MSLLPGAGQAVGARGDHRSEAIKIAAASDPGVCVYVCGRTEPARYTPSLDDLTHAVDLQGTGFDDMGRHSTSSSAGDSYPSGRELEPYPPLTDMRGGPEYLSRLLVGPGSVGGLEGVGDSGAWAAKEVLAPSIDASTRLWVPEAGQAATRPDGRWWSTTVAVPGTAAVTRSPPGRAAGRRGRGSVR